MSASKRQTTMAKLNRERAVEEKRTRKRLKKQAAREQNAAGATSEDEVRPEAEASPDAE